MQQYAENRIKKIQSIKKLFLFELASFWFGFSKTNLGN